MLDRLPFREIWAVDFEFVADPGERPVPVCMVARELRSDRLLRVWQDDLPERPPFDVGPDSLFVAYMAAAELGCFAALGWPVPRRVLDLYVEFRAMTNGRDTARPRPASGAVVAQHPRDHRRREGRGPGPVMRGGPWTPGERGEILDYCQTDVDPLGPLLERMVPAITGHPPGWLTPCSVAATWQRWPAWNTPASPSTPSCSTGCASAGRTSRST